MRTAISQKMASPIGSNKPSAGRSTRATLLLQCETGFEDRFPLRRTDLVVRELSALLELLVDDRAIQPGDADEDLLQLVVIDEGIFARLLVGRNHPPHDVGMILGELLAHIEDAPRIGVRFAVEQARAVFHLMLRHHRSWTRLHEKPAIRGAGVTHRVTSAVAAGAFWPSAA